MITRNIISDALIKSLRGVVDDSDSPARRESIIPKLFQEERSSKAFEDYQEYAGPAYIGERFETEGVTTAEMLRGYGTRIWMRSFGAKMIATEEAIEDNQYSDIIRCATYLRDAADNTRELDACMVFGRAFNTDYPMGDGLPLCSASHTLPDGRTWSNTLATPEAPSYRALNIMRAQARLLPRHDGTRSGLRVTKIAHPPEQDGAWDALLLSELAPYAGNTNEINIVRKTDPNLTHVSMLQLVNTSTNWFGMTNNPVGIKWFTRKALNSKVSKDDETGNVTYIIKERRGRGPVDARCVIGSEA